MRDGKLFPSIFVFTGIFGVRIVLFKCSGNRIIGNKNFYYRHNNSSLSQKVQKTEHFF